MHGFQNNLAQLFIWNICSGRLKIKVTLEDQTVKWSKLSHSGPLLLHLCMDFKIPWHNCSPSGVEVPFEIFVQVGWMSRYHLRSDNKMLIDWAVQVITSTFLQGFQNNLAPLFSPRSQSVIWNIRVSDEQDIVVTTSVQYSFKERHWLV